MLVLTRKEMSRGITLKHGEEVLCHLSILEVQPGRRREDGRVKMGFDAPDDVKIYRDELLDEDKKDGKRTGDAGKEGREDRGAGQHLDRSPASE